MREASDNPEANKLGPGVTEAALAKAISSSGHPLQAAVIDCVSDVLQSHGRLSAQEEWSYIDSESSQVRALDALVELSMWENDERGMNPRVRPVLNILIECKQTELPYVFFLREDGIIPSYPIVAGLPRDSITITTDDDPSTWQYDILDTVGLRSNAFATSPCPTAISFSKAVRRGSDLEITGEDSYRALTMPLLKATDHLIESSRPSNTRYFFDARLIVTLAVIRGPMIGVIREGSNDVLEALPWVRVHHLRPFSERDTAPYADIKAYDVVHESYLGTYLARLLGFATLFAKRSQDSTKVLIEGKGFTSGLGHEIHTNGVMPFDKKAQRTHRRLYLESTWMHIIKRVPPYGDYIRKPLSKIDRKVNPYDGEDPKHRN